MFSRPGLLLIDSRDAVFLYRRDMHAKLFGWFTVMHTGPGLEAQDLVSFGADGRIERTETGRLLMAGNGTMQKEVRLKLDYREVNGFRIPSRMDYRWTLEDGSLVSHYPFDVRDIRYQHQ